MTTSAAVPVDAPVMIAWEAYKVSPEYASSKRWALREEHTDGSLWAAFVEGFKAAGGSIWPSAAGQSLTEASEDGSSQKDRTQSTIS